MNDQAIQTLKINAGFNIESQFLHAVINKFLQSQHELSMQASDEQVAASCSTIDRIIKDLNKIKDQLQSLQNEGF